MAKKGQKFATYDEKQKEEILEQYISGISGYYLAKKYNLPVSTIKTWKTKIDHPEKITGTKRGRQKESEIDYKERYNIIKKYQAFLKAQRERK